MNLSAVVEQVETWRPAVRMPRAWQGLMALGLLLLAADLLGLGTFIRYLGGLFNEQPQAGLQAILFAASVSLTIAAGQIGYWAVHTGRVESFAGRRVFGVFIFLGAVLNVVGNFVYLVAGAPTTDNLPAAVDRAMSSPWGVATLVIYAFLALLVSLVPEYLLVLTLGLKQASPAEPGPMAEPDPIAEPDLVMEPELVAEPIPVEALAA